jgi:hypothetical protein
MIFVKIPRVDRTIERVASRYFHVETIGPQHYDQRDQLRLSGLAGVLAGTNLDFLYSEYAIPSTVLDEGFAGRRVVKSWLDGHEKFSHKELLHSRITGHQGYPQTYNLSNATECKQFFSLSKPFSPKGFKFMTKFGNDSSQGSGINFLTQETYSKLQKIYNHTKNCTKKSNIPILIQRYIEDPLLHDNKKIDFRDYLILISTTPPKAILIPGFIRLATFTYNRNSLQKEVHLTNSAINAPYGKS